MITTAVAGAAAVAAAAGYAYNKHVRAPKSLHSRPHQVTIELKDGQVTRATAPAGTEVNIVVSTGDTENPIVSNL